MSTSKPTASRANRPPSKIKLIAGVAGFIVIALIILTTLSGDEEATAGSRFYEVKRGDFMISIVEGGNIEALNEVSVRNDVEGSSRVIYIVPEGTMVKKGDLLVELDASGAEDQYNQQQITTTKADFALIQARETLAIQRSIGESDLSAAQLSLEFARTNLVKFEQGERLQQIRDAEIEIQNVRENLNIAQERLEWTEKLYEKEFETKSNLDKDVLAVNQYTMRLEQATNSLWMLKAFDLPKLKRQYESDVEEAEKELERVKHQINSRLAQYEADVVTQENTLKLNQAKLERDLKNLQGTKVFAPQDGLVVYPISNNRFSSESLIEEGATVRNRQELVKLPDTSRMKLTVKVHESHVSMVKPGQVAFVVLDPIPDQRFRGMVSKVGLMPDSQERFGNPDLKVYKTEILITDPMPDVKPGVSARAEIVITNLQNVISVPVQAVTSRRGKPVVYLAGNQPQMTPVDIGMFNTKFIEIKSGLEEGDQVLLSPPLDTEDADLRDSVFDDEENMTNEVDLATAQMPATPPVGADSSEPPVGRSGPGGFQPGRGGEGGPGGEGGQRQGGFTMTPEMRAEMLKEWDTDGDGEINEEERTAMREAMRARFGGGAGGRGEGGGPRGGGGERGGEGGGFRGGQPGPGQ